jgi:hypothetical protein
VTSPQKRQYNAERSAERKAWRDAGKCGLCGDVRDTNKKCCSLCLLERRLQAAANRARKATPTPSSTVECLAEAARSFRITVCGSTEQKRIPEIRKKAVAIVRDIIGTIENLEGMTG